MSIHPVYAEQILSGHKRVEFRKRPVAGDVTHVLIYATAPVRQVVGVFCVEEQVSESPRDLWGDFKEVGGIAYKDLMKYYRGHSVGTGIRVKMAYAASTPLSLAEDLGINHPPQSYLYLKADLAQRALALLLPQSTDTKVAATSHQTATVSAELTGEASTLPGS